MIDKWEQLRLLIEATLAHNVQYSHDKAFDRYSYQRVLVWMDDLDKREEEGFLFTGRPTFDQKAWEAMMEERGLPGLS